MVEQRRERVAVSFIPYCQHPDGLLREVGPWLRHISTFSSRHQRHITTGAHDIYVQGQHIPITVQRINWIISGAIKFSDALRPSPSVKLVQRKKGEVMPTV